MESKKVEFKNDSWLFSDSFIKRSLAVTGHNIVGTLIIYGIFLAFAVIVGGLVGLMSV